MRLNYFTYVAKKLQNWKNLVSTLVNIQAILAGGIMEDEML